MRPFGIFAVTILALSACKGDPEETGDSGVTDTNVTDTSPTDTGDFDPGVAATLTEGEVVTCEDPSLRASEGAYYLHEPGPDWKNQVEPSPQYGRGTAVADFDGDGGFDIFIPNLGRDQFFVSKPDGGMVDEAMNRFDTFSSMVTQRSQAAYAVDLDDDGDLDIVVANRGNLNRAHINDGTGNFTTTDVGFSAQGSASLAATFHDINGDGHLDIFFPAHFEGPHEGWSLEDPGDAEPAELYLSNGDGTFRDVSDTIPTPALLGYTNAAGFIDLDFDGQAELYVANDFGALTHHNHLYTIVPDGETVEFVDICDETGAEIQMFGMGIAFGDVNDDLYPDMFLTSWDELVLLESAPGVGYYNSADSRGIVPEYNHRDVAWAPEFADLDNDGDEDLFVIFGFLAGGEEEGLGNPVAQPDALYVRNDDGSYTQDAESWGLADGGIGRGFSFVDYNSDGFLDIVERDLGGPTALKLARCDDSRWLKLTLNQPAPNVNAIGARVVAHVDGKRMSRWLVLGGNNFSSASHTDLHFGLGEAQQVDKLEVFWPDGEVSRFTDVPSNMKVTIERSAE